MGKGVGEQGCETPVMLWPPQSLLWGKMGQESQLPCLLTSSPRAEPSSRKP